uniref:GDNF/GAS1 domain-containing protein n=1 Tax=Iconisemion striatum TaxID=60296 RepID=A0A1A7XMN5_9TELE
MEARQRCEEDSGCHASLAAYLSHCGQLFNGRKCSTKCKATIQQMLFSPNGMLLNRCVCDGVERPFCEMVKENMSKLCSIGDHSVLSDQDGEDLYEDEDYELQDCFIELFLVPPPLPHARLYCCHNTWSSEAAGWKSQTCWVCRCSPEITAAKAERLSFPHNTCLSLGCGKLETRIHTVGITIYVHIPFTGAARD